MTDETSGQPQPWQWDEPTWRGHVERVRAGARLVPAR
jgi:peptidoglycan-N-acetylglucosamine deacetylase